MEFQDVVRRRHMVRTFTGEPVPAQTLERILANAVRGPSAGFSQGQAVAGDAVTDENLGAVYFGIVPEAVQAFRDAFGVPDDHEPIGAIAIGSDAEPKPRDLRSRRRPMGKLVHYGQW